MTEPGHEIPKNLERFDRTKDLSPMEQVVLLGSSMGGYNWSKFREEADSKKLSPDFLIPAGWKFPVDSIQAQELTRRREEQHDLVGQFPFLNERIDELPQDYQVLVRPVGPVDQQTGRIMPTWELSIVKKKDFTPVESKPLGDLMQLSELHDPYFSLEDEASGIKLFHLKDELQ